MNASFSVFGNLTCAWFFIALAAPAFAALNLMKDFPPDVKVSFDATRKTVTRIEGNNLLAQLPDEARRAQHDPSAAAIAFVSAYRQIFLLVQPVQELRVLTVRTDELGFHHVHLEQVFHGLEVAGGEMLFHFNRDAALYLITASYIITPEIRELKPRLDSALAVRTAAAALSAKGNWPVALKIWPSPSGAALLAYEVTAFGAGWRLFVDARSGKILDRIPTISTQSSIVAPRSLPKSKAP